MFLPNRFLTNEQKMKTRSAPQHISVKYQTRNREHNNYYLESKNPFLNSIKTKKISNIENETSTLFSEIKLGKSNFVLPFL